MSRDRNKSEVTEEVFHIPTAPKICAECKDIWKKIKEKDNG